MASDGGRPLGGMLDDDSTLVDDLAGGATVGEYRIEGPLGEGGMGRVYAAVHPVIGKRAAIKVLRPELSQHREAVERFIQEARAVNQIGHPNIVDIFAFGRLADGRCYYVMELLRGESLRDRLRRGPLPLVDALSILDTITVALEAAHDKSIVHRDLKPDNVFLVDVKSDRPQVKLLDFGIAKLLSPDDFRMERTRTGNLLGTPGYISPEQARGHAIDHRTDIYALGALAFELVTGRLPFAADNAADMIAMHLVQPPPSACALVPGLPATLDDLIGRLMAKQAAQRPSLVIARDQLRLIRGQIAYGALAGQPVNEAGISTIPQATPPYAMPGPVARRRWPLIAGAVLAVAAGITVFAVMREKDEPAPAPHAPPSAPAVAAPAPSPPPPPAATPTPPPPPPPPVAAPAEPPAAAVAPPRPHDPPKTKPPNKPPSTTHKPATTGSNDDDAAM